MQSRLTRRTWFGACRLYFKFLLMFVPVFFVICAAGLYVLAERERGTAFDILTARVGNNAARVGVALQSAVDQGGVTRAAGQLHQHLIDTLLADNAIICAEFRSDRSGSVQLVSPFGVGCRGAAEGQLFRMETADEGQGELRVRFSTKEVEDAVRSRRELSLGILIGGLLIGLLASAVGFRIFIGRPLNRLLDAVREAPDSGTHEAVPVEGNDEIADVTNAYNTLQLRIADFSDRLEERVKERTFVAEMAAADARLANDELQKEVAVREEAQRDLRANAVKLQQQQIALNKLIREGILIGPKWRSAIRQITEICVATLNVQSCGVWFFLDDWTELSCLDKFDANAGIVLPRPSLPIAALRTYVGRIHTADIIAIDDVRTDVGLQEFREYQEPGNRVTSVLDAPIIRSGKLIGFVRLEQTGDPISWTPDEQVFATAVASLIAMVCENRDRLLVEGELRTSNHALEAATKAKSEFLATMSHEIRTPMNGVLGMLEILLDSDLTEQQRDVGNTARKAAQSLLVILNDILDLSRVEAGAVSIEERSFDLPALVEDVVDLLAPEVSRKGLTIDLEIGLSVPRKLIGDPVRLRQIFLNLVGNAIKFTVEGNVAIRVTGQPQSYQDHLVRVEIADTGIGVPEERIPDLFTRFMQVDSSATRKFGGTGLGLAISKQLVALMSGEMGVESKYGEGSVFWFELPMREAMSSPAEEAEAAPASYPEMESMRILVAEDNEVNQKLLRLLLSGMGHSVDVVEDGIKAIEAVSASDYDVILMDVQMPEMDGPTATRCIRNLGGRLAKLPIIAVTANVLPTLVRSYLDAGMDGCIEKPIRRDVLEAHLRNLAKVAREPSSETVMSSVNDDVPARTTPITPGPKEGLEPIIDQSAMSAWQEGLSADDVRNTLSLVPMEGEKCLQQIRSGLRQGDLAQVRGGAHRMKGMAGNLGAPRLMDAARRLELDDQGLGDARKRSDELERILKMTIASLEEEGLGIAMQSQVLEPAI